jgi:hypothetical protein
VLIGIFLLLSGTIGYLMGTRQNTQRELLGRFADRLAKLEEASETSTSTSGSESADLVQTVRGSGSTTTEIVSARGPWRLEWTGNDFFVFVKRAKGGDLVHGDGGQGSGSFVVHEDGRFVMDVVARGSWSMAVVRP